MEETQTILYKLVKEVADTFKRDDKNYTLKRENIKAVDELVQFVKENY